MSLTQSWRSRTQPRSWWSRRRRRWGSTMRKLWGRRMRRGRNVRSCWRATRSSTDWLSRRRIRRRRSGARWRGSWRLRRRSWWRWRLRIRVMWGMWRRWVHRSRRWGRSCRWWGRRRMLLLGGWRRILRLWISKFQSWNPPKSQTRPPKPKKFKT